MDGWEALSLCLGRAKAFFAFFSFDQQCESVVSLSSPRVCSLSSVESPSIVAILPFLACCSPPSPPSCGFCALSIHFHSQGTKQSPSLFPLLLSPTPIFSLSTSASIFSLACLQLLSPTGVSLDTSLSATTTICQGVRPGLSLPRSCIRSSRFTNKVFLVSILRRCFSFHAHILSFLALHFAMPCFCVSCARAVVCDGRASLLWRLPGGGGDGHLASSNSTRATSTRDNETKRKARQGKARQRQGVSKSECNCFIRTANPACREGDDRTRLKDILVGTSSTASLAQSQDWSARPVLASPVQYQPTSQLQQGQNSPKLWPSAHRPFSTALSARRPFLLLAATHQQLDAHHHPRDHTWIICCSHLTLPGGPSDCYYTILFLVSPLASLSGSLRNILPATTRGTTLFTRCCARSTARRSLPAPAARNATHKPPPSRPRACTRLATSRHTHSLHSSTHHLPLPLSPSHLTHSLTALHPHVATLGSRVRLRFVSLSTDSLA